jgi:hypothetical protein|tara:strand:+ start:5264 stop:6505 length:1242 start_codon:yes stop_codon:yes gene_type:complete
MASSYSSDLKLELMVTGENAGTWGDKTNTNLNLVQQAIAGFEQVTLSSGGTVTLVMSDGALSNARNLVIKFATASIAASTICAIPDSIEKFYIFDCRGLTNPSNLTIKTVSGTGFTPDAAKIYAAYSDGTNITEVSLDTLGGSIGTAQIADDAVTNAKIADDAIRAAQLSDNAVVTAAILDANVTTDKIADDAVTAAKLADTSVSAGSYTTANITVDAQGRLTAAASGAGGDGSYVPRILARGPVSTNYASPANASKFYAYAISGGGGGAGGSQRNPAAYGGDGGKGACGFYAGAAQASTTYAYEIGAGGSGNPASGSTFGGNGGAGGQTKVGNLFLCDGGPGGNGPGTGNSPGQQQPDQPATNATIEFPREMYGFNPVAGKGGSGGMTGPYPSRVGNAGEPGFLHYFDDGGQ